MGDHLHSSIWLCEVRYLLRIRLGVSNKFMDENGGLEGQLLSRDRMTRMKCQRLVV